MELLSDDELTMNVGQSVEHPATIPYGRVWAQTKVDLVRKDHR